MQRALLWAGLCGLIASPAWASPIVAATGDSQTSAYGAVLQYQFNRFGIAAQSLRFASGGASAPL
jgi:hypothetical protein